MKKYLYKITVFLIIQCLIILMIFTNVWADPNGNKGMFSFTDEEADKQAQEQIKEQEKELNVTEVKSSDNYLTSLQVEGYTLTPEFDKQTLEYTIKEDVTTNIINIKTKTSNEKATVSGNGEVKLEDNKNEYRIDVKAESGAIRTYIIKLNKGEIVKPTNEQVEEKTNNVLIQAKEVEKNKEQEQDNDVNNSSNLTIYIIIIIVLVLIVSLSIFITKNKKKGKH